MTDIEYVRCTCGGNHGVVPLFVPPGTTERWCVIAWNDQFQDCPGCKARRRNGVCGRGCRECRIHGWHEGRSCSACESAPGIGKAIDTYVVTPAIWTFLGLVALGGAFVVLSGILLTFPFMEMLGRWFIDNGFPVIGWAIILPIPLIVVLALVLKAAISEYRS